MPDLSGTNPAMKTDSSDDRPILESGRNCWKVEHASRLATLVDAADYFSRPLRLTAVEALTLLASGLAGMIALLVRTGSR